MENFEILIKFLSFFLTNFVLGGMKHWVWTRFMTISVCVCDGVSVGVRGSKSPGCGCVYPCPVLQVK